MRQLHIVAELMALSARTSPKGKGEDFIVTQIVEGDDLAVLGRNMIEFGERTGKELFDRDAKNVMDSAAVLLIGMKDATALGLNCGACGAEKCVKINTYEGEFTGPQCSLRMLDLGIATGSAVKTASILNADNRIMYRIGPVAKEMGLIDADVILGIPISATGKSIYFDR
ncbi:MAG: hypothetical protein CEE40_11215 [Chloroflexi bacterium B3_Chlor]|nr:MAG: hypothetical protein CEE40_11215 [Chloroflexi bacterium B3_Chlor]